MSKKEQCKTIMEKLFGPATAAMVESSMTEEDCVEKCRIKTQALLGAEKAKEFENIS